MHPDYLLQALTAEQLAEWELYCEHEPIGDSAADMRIARLQATVTNLAGSAWSKPGIWKSVVPQDFVYDWWKEKPKDKPKKQSVEEQKSILQSIAQIFGAKKKGTVQHGSPGDLG